jgi:hypothetical protein
MGAQSNLYNFFSRFRVDRGDDRYYALEAGAYLICVSTTRNEPLDYELGLVVEFPPTEMFIALEDEGDIAYLLQETSIDFSRTINVISPVSVNTVISSSVEQPNGFTELLCAINSGITVTVLNDSTWFIGDQIPSEQGDKYWVNVDTADDQEYFLAIHDHSLSEWQQAWESEHQDTDKFPDIFIPLTNRP